MLTKEVELYVDKEAKKDERGGERERITLCVWKENEDGESYR